MADVQKLIWVLHHLLGGGQVVVAGTPEDVVAAGSHTGRALAPVLARASTR
ncbi:hypothetical protein [Caldimonas sp.]|uniref:hypothetical protein n=1 Tax=Caldimonas sp. TaxID=2838790 RepID=UPI00307E48A5